MTKSFILVIMLTFSDGATHTKPVDDIKFKDLDECAMYAADAAIIITKLEQIDTSDVTDLTISCRSGSSRGMYHDASFKF